MNETDYDIGLAIRREALEAEHVDKAIAAADDFNRPIQDMVTAWACDLPPLERSKS